MTDQTMPYSHGEVCEHDKLKRQCDDCRNEWEIERLRFIIALLRDEAKAWRKHDDLHDCEDDRSRRLASIAAHNRACEAAQRTDAAGALEDK